MTTSFRNIFRQGHVTHIEIPIIQRDYAQGRKDVGVTRIRKAFLQVLHGALTSSKEVGLDFVYGETEDGRLIPLDGQQRLTTLFLLHWYLAARSSINEVDCAFLGKFTYKTRFSARHFCEKLIAQRPPFPLTTSLSDWLIDQHWYAGAWKHDPTIQSMLVVLDDIHHLFAHAEASTCRTAWNRLVDEVDPAITFEFLSLEGLGLSDELYIKMNSRGKPLTRFEHFKADFEKILDQVNEEARKEFVRKVDQDWSDLLWPLRKSTNKRGHDDTDIDDEFLRLFHFITDIVIYRHGLSVEPNLINDDIDLWAERIYGQANAKDPRSAQRYLFDALDGFFAEFNKMKEPGDFADWFANFLSEKGYRADAVAIFDKVDLFGDCCAKYGIMQGPRIRAFPLSRTLLLFAFLEYLMLEPRPPVAHFAQRLRTLRNLIFASDDEIRLDNFPALLNESAEYVRSGDSLNLQTYNRRQIAEENHKSEFLRRHSGNSDLVRTLHRLEDHELLRGCLAAFDLQAEASTFTRRAELFQEIFPADGDPPVEKIGAALLACGDYWQRTRNGRYQFGSPKPSQLEVWRRLLTSADITSTRAALLTMLDQLGDASGASVGERLQAVADDYVARQERAKRFNWRYYLVKYPVMRSGDSGRYASNSDVLGFDLCMLDKTQLNSYYRDPYLLAVIELSGAQEDHDVAKDRHYGWDSYPSEKRWIQLYRSGHNVMSCRPYGFELQAPRDAAERVKFLAVCQKHGVTVDNSRFTLQIPQTVARQSR